MWPVWPESCAATARLTGRREAGDGGDDGDGGGDGGGDDGDGDGDGDGGGGEAAADGGVEREIARSRESRVRAIDACLPLDIRGVLEQRDAGVLVRHRELQRLLGQQGGRLP